MRRTRSRVLDYSLPVLAILVLLTLLTHTLIRLTDIQQGMRNNVNANMVWVLYQTHIESLMLGDAIQQQLLGSASLADITHHYQMLESRVGVLNDGPQKRALEAIGMADALAEQAKVVMHMGRAADVLAQRAGYETLRGVLDQFNAQLLEASNKAMVAQWEEAGAQIDTYRNAVLTIVFLMVGVWVCSAFISIQLLQALRKSRNNERIKQRELELQKQLENERRISGLYRSFGSMISHQFRTPLAIIDAAMQRLIRSSGRLDAREVTRRAVQARDATQRLTHLIDNILHADRFLEQLEVTMAPCCLARLARQAVAESEAFAPAHNLQIVDETQGDAMVQCDPVLTGQIIANFLSNAVKYSEDHQPVAVRVYREGRWVCCAVKDHGRGISPDDVPHLFKRYFRASTATDVLGTGIGLHIAMELASLQHGEIQVSSELGTGTTFVLRLPRTHRGSV